MNASACRALGLLIILPACSPERESAPASFMTGLEAIQAEDFAVLAGSRVGLVTNHTGLDRNGRSIVDIFHRSDKVELKSIFSPEHGFAGSLDQAEIADDEHDSGIAIYSLQGARRKPGKAELQGIDTLVFDIQDIGCRFYTYITTMLRCMEAASEHDLRMVILDRPNPIGGIMVTGPVLDAELESTVGCHPLPVRHGMTVGELARMMAAERKLDIRLQVVPMQGWTRDMLYDQTPLPWIDPSPNMRSLEAALLYPGVGLLEFTNLSVGRGTATPFEVLGAPWLDSEALAARIRSARLPGVSVEAIRFTPDASKYAGEECAGLRFRIADPRQVQSLALGMELATGIRDLHPDEWQAEPYQKLLCDRSSFAALVNGASSADLQAGWQAELAEFMTRRARYLLY
ncbi:MAG: exo-beta-N-acetylmuramidase NamZ family protein [Planctomycetota bacterium]|jgi:uncharacterized protein YbbC (DUF1343 family)